MTKIQMQFRLQRPLDEASFERISDAYAIYGIQKIEMAPTEDALIVEYDATRLRPAEVESVLAQCGIPIEINVP